MPLKPFGFPSIVVASSNDEFVSLGRARYFSDCRGSGFVFLSKAGHINTESNLGNWTGWL